MLEAGAADGAADKTVELQQLRSRIRALQADLQANLNKKTRVGQSLQQTEQAIGQSLAGLKKIEARLAGARERLQTLEQERGATLEKLDMQSSRLAAEARAAYMMGRQQQVKLLMNQEQPAALGRMLNYYNYISHARQEQIAAMRSSLARLEQLEEKIEDKNHALLELRREREAEAKALQAQREQRQALVARLVSELGSQGDALQKLRQDEQQLQALIESLREALADIPVESEQRVPFRDRKGQLRWPVRGDLAQQFGTQRGDSGLKWQGVVIAAAQGRQVRAISQGRVAFADWLRGFGLLLIIDHGDGYMSLYGRNEALYKEVGEWVDSGEVVATTGASGGQGDTGLYFELRHKGKPFNPRSWCAGSPATAPG